MPDSKLVLLALTKAEVRDYIAAYANAASNAVHRAGFDGVKIHSAGDYLPDQFFQITSNKRTDRWGGEECRTRFSGDIVDAVVDAVGEDRVAIRLGLWSTFQGKYAFLRWSVRCRPVSCALRARGCPIRDHPLHIL